MIADNRQRTSVPSAAGARVSRASRVLRVAVIAMIILLTFAYYFWTSICSFDEVPVVRPREYRETDHYNLLTRGFLNGHLHLAGDVPTALLNAPNPYDPLSRGAVEVLHDASFYRGKYYIYFGPAPVVTLFLPFSVLTGRDLPLPYGVLVFVAGTFGVLTTLFLFVQRRYFPRAGLATTAAALLAIGAGSLTVALLRRPNIWEMAGASGLFFCAISVLCLVRALHSDRAAVWSVFGGFALGLAVASRPTYLVCSALFALPLLFRRRAGEQFYGWRPLLAAAASCAVAGVGLMAYNYARFENPFEFGQKYQLSSIIEGDARHFSVSYVAWNLRVYFLSALRWTASFPFHQGIVVPPLPPGHAGYEYAFGLCTNLPFSLLGLGCLFSVWRRRTDPTASSAPAAPAPRTLHATMAIVACAALLPAGILLFYFGACIRYMADFVPWFMLLAAFGVLAIESHLGSRIARRFFSGGALIFALLAAGVAGVGVVPLYNVTTGTPPPAYDRVARWLNYPAFLARLIRWPEFRPREITLTFPASPARREETLLSVVRDGRTHADVRIEYLGDGKLRFAYHEPLANQSAFSPVIAPDANRHTLQISLGTNYAEYDGRALRFRLQFDGQLLWGASIVSFHALGGEIRGARAADPDAFSGQIHSQRAIRDGDFAAPRLGGARVRVALTPEMAGRSFPLVSSGRNGAGDLLFLRVETDGRITLGYDHWADALRLSAPLATAFGREHVVEFWIPAVNGPTNPRGQRDLVVRIDGAIQWRQPAPWFETTPKTLFIGENPIGGSTCERMLINGVIENLRLPPPDLPD